MILKEEKTFGSKRKILLKEPVAKEPVADAFFYELPNYFLNKAK